MPEIAIVNFVDFALANGPTRLTKVRAIKQQVKDGYSPATDFYKRVREGIVGLHEGGHSLKYLDGMVKTAHYRKREHYAEIVKGYKKFLRGKEIDAFDPRSALWQYRTLTVKANPELGMKIDRVSHLVKLYFKSDKLSQRRADVALHLMSQALGSRRTKVALLDTRRGKLYTPTENSADMDAFLKGEAAAFIEMWRLVS